MDGPMREAGENVQAARDRITEARDALERDPGEEVVEDPSVWDTINSALYDIDHALAKATLATKQYVSDISVAADDGYDELVEELAEAREGVKRFWEGLTEHRPTRKVGERLRRLEDRLDGLLARLTGEDERES